MDTGTDIPGGEAALPEYVIEAARSGRSRCKACRKAIAKGALRLGFLIEGPFGTGYLWHHLNCAARRFMERVEEAYALEAWKAAKVPVQDLPSLDDLRGQAERAEQTRKERRVLPYAEIDPSGRAACKECSSRMEKGAFRVVLGRKVEFGSQTRISPINVHPACVGAALEAEDSGTEAAGLRQALEANSSGLSAEQMEQVIASVEADPV